MARLRENFESGLITDNPLSNSATTINSDEFASLPEVSGGDTLVLILDPLGAGNGPEIVTVTAHTASATSVTVTRASEDGTDYPAVEHAQSTPWIHGPTAADWDEAAQHNHDTAYADIAHEDSTDGHPTAVASVSDGFLSAADKNKLDGIDAGATDDMTADEIRALGFFDISNDGAGSGLDADKLDGVEGSGYATSGHAHALDDLSDVNESAPDNNEVLAYHSPGGEWRNQTAAEAGLSVVGHDHVAASVTDLLTYIKENTPGLLLAYEDQPWVAGNLLTASFANVITTDLSIPYSGETVVVAIDAAVRINTPTIGDRYVFKLRSNTITGEDQDEFELEFPDLTDPGHDHNIPSDSHSHSIDHTHLSGTYVADVSTWHGVTADVAGTTSVTDTSGGDSHDHGDADSNTTGVTKDAPAVGICYLHALWVATLPASSLNVNIGGKYIGGSAETPDVRYSIRVHRAWS